MHIAEVAKLVLTRQEKGKLLYESGKVHKLPNDDIYFVESETQKDKGYEVLYTLQACQCKDYVNRAEPCKHIFACTYEKSEAVRQMLTTVQLKAINKVTPQKWTKIGIIQ